MSIIRGVLFGSAAAILAAGGAQAADLPLKAKAVEYVKICTLYGAGFYYIPGTDTCVKLGGYLRVDANFNAGTHHNPYWNGDNGQHNRYANYFNDRSRMAFTVDTRTATEYGVVRTFGQAYFQFSTLGSSQNPNSLNTSLGNNANLLDTPGGGYFNDYFREIGVKTDKSVNFHSFRHGIADAFRSAGYMDEQFNVLLGHTKATTTGRYGILPEGILSQRVAMIEAVEFRSLHHLFS